MEIDFTKAMWMFYRMEKWWEILFLKGKRIFQKERNDPKEENRKGETIGSWVRFGWGISHGKYVGAESRKYNRSAFSGSGQFQTARGCKIIRPIARL